ncbi:hypothetical protein DXT99_26005 [Pontibacter diazotrophicus]|uniref:Uncharacterized protein n=1 Tax=Pontibacter diazotrophicus TaxID=1400979 RepID=A0A3D8L136_9BACT|nr:hypothetical protein DXT99_26005 [Pontibacter diazotrophicus]
MAAFTVSQYLLNIQFHQLPLVMHSAAVQVLLQEEVSSVQTIDFIAWILRLPHGQRESRRYAPEVYLSCPAIV